MQQVSGGTLMLSGVLGARDLPDQQEVSCLQVLEANFHATAG